MPWLTSQRKEKNCIIHERSRVMTLFYKRVLALTPDCAPFRPRWIDISTLIPPKKCSPAVGTTHPHPSKSSVGRTRAMEARARSTHTPRTQQVVVKLQNRYSRFQPFQRKYKIVVLVLPAAACVLSCCRSGPPGRWAKRPPTTAWRCGCHCRAPPAVASAASCRPPPPWPAVDAKSQVSYRGGPCFDVFRPMHARVGAEICGPTK